MYIKYGASQVTRVVKDQPAKARDLRDMVYILESGRPLEEGMATHSSIFSRIPWTEEPGGLQSIESQRVGHDWSDIACVHIKYMNLAEVLLK